MAAKDSNSVLGRKLAAASEADLGQGRSILRALRLSLARTALDLYELPLAVIGTKQARCEQDGTVAYLTDDRLLVLLDGADGLAGAVSLDGPCVAALIQQQTMGQVSAPAMAKRAFTSTDAALAEPLIEMLLSKAADLADASEDRRCLSGFRFGARVDDVRTLGLALDADRFRVIELTIDIAEGVTQGAICLVLPDVPVDPVAGSNKGGDPPGPVLDQSFGVMRTDLTATICRLRIPLAELAAMQPGDVLPLVRDRLEETELVAINGQSIAVGRLGQINGSRAVRLNETRPSADPSGPPEEGGFATRVVNPAQEAAGMLTLNGPVASPSEEMSGPAGVPALNGEGGTESDNEDQESDAENLISHMTPQEAAAEISQLAGLSLNDTEN